MHRESKHLFVRKGVGRGNYEIAKKIMDIRNKHLVRIDHVFEYDGAFFVLEDYIAGQTLEELLEERGVLTEEESRQYASQILEGLDVLHGRGIVHRDVTPANIMISVDGVAKLIDYGISRVPSQEKQRDTTILFFGFFLRCGMDYKKGCVARNCFGSFGFYCNATSGCECRLLGQYSAVLQPYACMGACNAACCPSSIYFYHWNGALCRDIKTI